MNNETQIPPERLMEAVDAVFEAWREVVAVGGTLRHPLEMLGSDEQPECLKDFTQFEIEEASAFLTRMGVIEIRPKDSEERESDGL